MRLKKLYVSNYKNLKELTLDFELCQGLIMLIGNNGSGKSNILEALSAIFYDAHRKDSLFFSKIADKYSIEYEIDGHDAIIERKGGRRYFKYDNRTIKQDIFIREGHLPNNVIAVYSGEESRLWANFFEPYYKAYIRRIKSNIPQGRMKLMFVNKYYWNIALLVLLLSENNTLQPFIENDLHISTVNQIKMSFDFSKIDAIENENLKAFIMRINPESVETLSFSLENLRQTLSGLLDREIYNWFIQAFMPKYDKIITEIEIKFNEDIITESLSEGEKKLILVKAVLEILADERTFILFDEPDAHIHEGRKKALYDMLYDYASTYNRQIVMTTHSPTMAQIADSHQLIMLKANGDGITPVPTEKFEKVKELTSDAWTVSEQTLFFNSTKPLLLVEGQGDAMYIKKAIKVLAATEEKYKVLDIDVLPFGGASNAKSFIDEFKPCVNSDKKVIVLFDCDDAGCDGLFKIINRGKDRANSDIFIFNDWYYLKLPKTAEHTELDFVIEDYFSKAKKKAVAQVIIDTTNGVFTLYPRELRECIKKELAKDIANYTSVDLSGFAILLDKIIAILDGTETLVTA